MARGHKRGGTVATESISEREDQDHGHSYKVSKKCVKVPVADMMMGAIEAYLRTQWSQGVAHDVVAALSRITSVFFASDAVRVIGAKWYRPKAAGSTTPVPITLRELREGAGWVRQSLVPGQ